MNKTFLLACLLLLFLAIRPVSAALAIDAFAANYVGIQNNANVVLSTSNSPDVIYIVVGVQAGGSNPSVTITDTSGLTWTERGAVYNSLSGLSLYAYSNVVSTTLSSDKITAAISSTSSASVIAVAVSGANTISPFDSNTGLPANAFCGLGGSCGLATVSIGTKSANDLVIGAVVGGGGSGNLPSNTAYIELTQGVGSGANEEGALEYNSFATAQTNLAVSWGGGGDTTGTSFIAWADAFQPAPPQTVTVSNPSNSFAVVGQSELFTATISNDISVPYTYNYVMVNSISGKVVDSLSVSNSLTTNTVIYTLTSADAQNSPELANVIVKDNGGVTFASSNSATFVVGSKVTPPTNILYYLPITLTNTQNTLVVANTPLAVGVSAGKVIGLSTNSYSQYYTCNLNNAEFFFSNGIIINSWLEGNYLNEYFGNYLCSSSSSANALVNSANTLYWIEANWDPNFLAANTGTATTNIIYLGWAGNTLTNANNLLNNANTGMAPQLTLVNPYNTIAGNYGLYDDGASVFTYYTNFNGVALPGGWTKFGTFTMTVDNGFAFNTPNAAIGIYYNGIAFSNGIVVDAAMECHSDTSAANNCGATGIAQSATTTNGYSLAIQMTQVFRYTIAATQSASTLPASFNTLYETTSGLGATYTDFFGNYNSIIRSTTNPLAYFGTNALTISQGANTNTLVQWIRVRPIPPNDILPSTSLGSVVQVLVFGSSGASNSFADQGQTEVITTNINGGIPPYSYNIIVTNSVNGNVIGNMLISNSLTANSFFFTLPSTANDLGQMRISANIVDSVNSQILATGTPFSVNSALSTTLSSSNQIIDQQQIEALTAVVSGGTGPYTYNYFVTNPQTGNIVFESTQNNALTTNTVTFTLGTDGNIINNLTITANVFDSASTNNNAIGTNSIIVKQHLLANPLPFGLDGSANCIGGATTCIMSLTTTNANDMIWASCVNFNGGTPTIADAAQLTWIGMASSSEYQIWRATSANILSSDSITCTVAGNTGGYTGAAFAISGSTATLDGITDSTTQSGAVTTTPTVGPFSTTNVNDFLLMFADISSNVAPITPGPGYICIQCFQSGGGGGVSIGSEYEITSILQNSVNALFNDGGLGTATSEAWGVPALCQGACYTLSNSNIEVGQISTANTVISGGIAPYTANWAWIAPTSSNIAIGNTILARLTATNTLLLTINAISSNSLALTFNGVTYYANAIGTNTIYGTWAFNGFVQDQQTYNTIATNTILISPALSGITLTPSPILPTSLNPGQVIDFTASWSGGTNTFSANYLITNTITNALVANMLYTGISAGSNTFAWNIPSNAVGNTLYANVIVIDGLSESANSINSNTLTIVPISSGGGGGSSGGGGPAPAINVELSDNLNSSMASDVAVAKASVINPLTDLTVVNYSLNQNQLPGIIRMQSGQELNFSFACSFTINETSYSYYGEIYGIGFTACNKVYTGYGGSFEAVYVKTPQTNTITSTSTATSTLSTTSTTISTISSTTTTINATAIEVEHTTINASESKHAQVNFENGNLSLNIALISMNPLEANVTLTNRTSNVTTPQNYSKIYAFDINVTSSVEAEVNVTFRYNCKINPNSIVPFYLSNDTWTEIYNVVVLPDSCTISFQAPNHSVVGIFEAVEAPETTTTISPPVQKQSQTDYYAIAAAIVIIAVLAIYAALRMGRRR